MLRRQYLRRIYPGVGIEVLHQPLEVRRFAAGNKCRAAPIVQQRAGQFRACPGGQLVDDQFALAQPRKIHGSEKAAGRPMLRVQSRFHASYIRVESGVRLGRGLRRNPCRRGQQEQKSSRRPTSASDFACVRSCFAP